MSVSTDHEITFGMPEIPYSTIPVIERLLEYCDALDAVATGELAGMPEDARERLTTALAELRGYIEEVVTAELDELCDYAH